MTPPERYSDRIYIEPNSGCWLWTGATTSGGYSSIRTNGSARQGHLVIYEMLRGPLPEPFSELDHLCRTRCCVNPDHMEPVTRGENNRRSTCHHHAAFRANVKRKSNAY